MDSVVSNETTKPALDPLLGRVRSTVNTYFYVYPQVGGQWVRVLNELTGRSTVIHKLEVGLDPSPGIENQVAAAWFEENRKHPLKEPWLDSAAGEIWRVVFDHEVIDCQVVFNPDGEKRFVSDSRQVDIGVYDPQILRAVRV